MRSTPSLFLHLCCPLPLVALAFLVARPAPVAAAPQANAKPNIIFILADDAGLGDFSCYGAKYVPTPNIDKMATEGMRFTRGYSGSAVCAPTRCVLMTGQHTGHCIRRANQSKSGLIPLPDKDVTVAEALKAAGYATGGFGKWGLGNPGTEGVPEKQGFDEWFGYYDQVHAHDYYTDHLVRNSVDVPLPGNAKGKKGQYTHDVIAEETLKFIDQNKDRPFFVYAAWTPPHGDYVIPNNAPYGDKPWPMAVKNYAAMIAKVDADVGRVIAKLKALGLDERTIVFFSSDNGPNPEFIKVLGSNGGLRGQKRILYEAGFRAPFIARWPGKIAPGTTSDLMTSHVDFFPTACELSGATLAPARDGISIVPALMGQTQARDGPLYFEIYEPYFQQAVRLGDWKGYRTGTKAPLELYDLKTDPAEERNVAAQNADVVKQLEAIMAREHSPTPHWDTPEQPKKAGAGPAAGGGKKKKAAPEE